MPRVRSSFAAKFLLRNVIFRLIAVLSALAYVGLCSGQIFAGNSQLLGGRNRRPLPTRLDSESSLGSTGFAPNAAVPPDHQQQPFLRHDRHSDRHATPNSGPHVSCFLHFVLSIQAPGTSASCIKTDQVILKFKGTLLIRNIINGL